MTLGLIARPTLMRKLGKPTTSGIDVYMRALFGRFFDCVVLGHRYPDDDKTQYLYESYPRVVSPLEGV